MAYDFETEQRKLELSELGVSVDMEPYELGLRRVRKLYCKKSFLQKLYPEAVEKTSKS